MAQQAPVQASLAAGDHVDQGDSEEHRHRVVAARLDFQRSGNPLVQAFAAQQREHRRSVGRADDGADQQALDQAEVEQPGGDQAGEGGGDHYPDRGQRQRRPQCHAKACHPCAQATVEQDHCQCQVAHQVGGGVVVEDDAATIHTGDHADGEDDDQDRDAQARRQRADQDTCTHQQCADQEQAIDGACIQRQVLRNSGGRDVVADFSAKASRSRANRF
ncbi:FAD-dependent oxidoreductase [Pseudomonas monteilii]|uniref:FAD-dependent oxidoreductase n=1 Tax=Pseudomonas monteilii TaxID=76759 RepID=A0AAE6RI00_9PSED|nr:FAD-dependent oxidoreductase [Pseudomonas monteilii]